MEKWKRTISLSISATEREFHDAIYDEFDGVVRRDSCDRSYYRFMGCRCAVEFYYFIIVFF